MFHKSSYSSRIPNFQNPTAKKLLECMERKQSNLSLAADVLTMDEILEISELCGPYICCLKTHVDVVMDFSLDKIKELVKISEKYDFLIFEDRKFADIGNTVKLQYQAGIYHIVDWADITNAHPIPGEGIIQGLSSIGLSKGRGLLLLAEMSSKGNLCSSIYAEETMKMAEKYPDFVFGFIGQRRLKSDLDWIYMTPGVSLSTSSDSMGQQYRTPKQVLDSGCDVIIVGRGLYEGFKDDKEGVKKRAMEYQKQGWDAYLARVEK